MGCSIRKGKKLRTADDKKVVTLPSAVGVDDPSFASLAFDTAIASLEDSKAEDIIPIDLRGRSALGDYMIIASGRSHRHVSAVADYLLRALRDIGYREIRVEGQEGGDWVLVDTGDIIVHIFHPEVREFYNLEKIWIDPDADGTKSGRVH